MQLLVVTKFGRNIIVDAQAIPPKGAAVDLFYKPYPIVTDVLMWPNKETLRALKVENFQIEAVVFVN
jgi:hypothetical protein